MRLQKFLNFCERMKYSLHPYYALRLIWISELLRMGGCRAPQNVLLPDPYCLVQF